MFGNIEPYSGHFFNAQYQEWDKNTQTYKEARTIRIKGSAGIGISSGIKETILVMENNRPVSKDTFRVNTVDSGNFTVKSKLYIPFEDKMYVIEKVSPDITHQNTMSNLMFSNNINIPKVLNLGE